MPVQYERKTSSITNRTLHRLLKKFGWEIQENGKYFHEGLNLKNRSAHQAIEFEAGAGAFLVLRTKKQYPLVLPNFKLNDLRNSCV